MGGKWYLQAWSQGAGTSGFLYYFIVADVLRELGVTSIEMLVFALLSGLKSLLCIYFLLPYPELKHGVREGNAGYFGEEYRPFPHLAGRSCLCWKLMSLQIRFFNAYSDGKIEQPLPVVTAHPPPVGISCLAVSHWFELPCFQCSVAPLLLGGCCGFKRVSSFLTTALSRAWCEL